MTWLSNMAANFIYAILQSHILAHLKLLSTLDL